jgi:hypothetical protein
VGGLRVVVAAAVDVSVAGGRLVSGLFVSVDGGEVMEGDRFVVVGVDVADCGADSGVVVAAGGGVCGLDGMVPGCPVLLGGSVDGFCCPVGRSDCSGRSSEPVGRADSGAVVGSLVGGVAGASVTGLLVVGVAVSTGVEDGVSPGFGLVLGPLLFGVVGVVSPVAGVSIGVVAFAVTAGEESPGWLSGDAALFGVDGGAAVSAP